MPNNNAEENKGRLTCQKLNYILNNNAEKMQQKLVKTSNNISEMRKEMIKNLVEENKKLQEKVEKIFEKVMYSRVVSFLDSQNLIYSR